MSEGCGSVDPPPASKPNEPSDTKRDELAMQAARRGVPFDEIALVAFHGYIESCCRYMTALAEAFDQGDRATAALILRDLCVALLSAERAASSVAGAYLGAASALLRTTIDAALPVLARAWNTVPVHVERVFADLAQAHGGDSDAP